MGRIAVEILPRDVEVLKKYPRVDCVNIPDILSH